MRRHLYTIIALSLGASLLLGDVPVGAAAPRVVGNSTKETIKPSADSVQVAAKRKKR